MPAGVNNRGPYPDIITHTHTYLMYKITIMMMMMEKKTEEKFQIFINNLFGSMTSIHIMNE